MPHNEGGNVQHESPGQLPLMGGGHPPTLERRAYVNGLFQELMPQLHHHKEVAQQMLGLQAQIGLTERSLRVTRDHLLDVLSHTNEEVPPEWHEILDTVQFVGVRLGDACVQVLRKRESLAVHELLHELNEGQMRFRTGTPLKEITAALLRQPRVRRDGDHWVYVPEEQPSDETEKEAVA